MKHLAAVTRLGAARKDIEYSDGLEDVLEEVLSDSDATLSWLTKRKTCVRKWQSYTIIFRNHLQNVSAFLHEEALPNSYIISEKEESKKKKERKQEKGCCLSMLQTSIKKYHWTLSQPQDRPIQALRLCPQSLADSRWDSVGPREEVVSA